MACITADTKGTIIALQLLMETSLILSKWGCVVLYIYMILWDRLRYWYIVIL